VLAPGARVGTFEILAPLGAGGMGEVYRARDTRLGRDVAIKVMPAERLSDPNRRARFVQEAKAASALNHPHIVTIHEIESADGIDFIVMELVPGKTLDALIPKSGMRLGEALRVAIPIADALAAAHAKGIVHRDLKPGNVVVTPEGVPKVLDFGLAKLAESDENSTEEATTLEARAPLSHPGTAIGTPAYMSPEQASGGAVDARSDIFSFGVVLYEMVTGRRPFAGGSSAEVHAALLKDQPKPPSELVPGVPRDLERIILRCLRKEPGRRFQNVADVKIELLELKEESDSQGKAHAGAVELVDRPGRYRTPRVLVGVAVLAAVAAVTLWRLRQPEPPAPNVVQLSSERWAGPGSFSPDGTQIAYGSGGDDGVNWDIWLKIVGQPDARRLTTDPAAESYPSWSPDGTQIAFLRYDAASFGGLGGQGVSYFAAGAVHLMSALGGPLRRVSDLPARLQISWSPDGAWLAVSRARSGSNPPGGIYLISVASGETRAVTFPKPSSFDVCPAFAPDGRSLAYGSCSGSEGIPPCDVYVLSLDAELKPRASAGPLTQHRSRIRGLAWTRDGRSIVYAAGASPQSTELWRVLAHGGAAPARIELGPRAHFPSVAPSRDRLAFFRPSGDADLYRLHIGGASTALIRSTFMEVHPQLSPDGSRIAFGSNRTGGEEIWLAEADGANPTRLTRGPGVHQGSPSWSSDGRSIVFDSQDARGQVDIWTIGSDGSGLTQITRDPAEDSVPSFSRDGRYIYFGSNRTGRSEVWRVAAGGGQEGQLTHEGGEHPLESLDGRTLYFLRTGLSSGQLMARSTAAGEERTVLPCVFGFGYAVAPHGLLHVACGDLGPAKHALLYWDVATGKDRTVATLEGDYLQGLSAFPDGQSIVYSRGTASSDLMMIENFR